MIMPLADEDTQQRSHADLVRMFEDCSLGTEEFSHREHVRLGWIYLRHHGLFEAVERFRTGLHRFTHHHGAPGKMHETITGMYMLLISDRMNGDARHSWETFVRQNSDLLVSSRRLLLRYYRPETLASDHARRTFVMPDRSPFLGSDPQPRLPGLDGYEPTTGPVR